MMLKLMMAFLVTMLLKMVKGDVFVFEADDGLECGDDDDVEGCFYQVYVAVDVATGFKTKQWRNVASYMCP